MRVEPPELWPVTVRIQKIVADLGPSTQRASAHFERLVPRPGPSDVSRALSLGKLLSATVTVVFPSALAQHEGHGLVILGLVGDAGRVAPVGVDQHAAGFDLEDLAFVLVGLALILAGVDERAAFLPVGLGVDAEEPLLALGCSRSWPPRPWWPGRLMVTEVVSGAAFSTVFAGFSVLVAGACWAMVMSSRSAGTGEIGRRGPSQRERFARLRFRPRRALRHRVDR